MNEKITVIVPVYNEEKYIKECIDSILDQTYKNIEVLIINDGSNDNTNKILAKFNDKRIKIYNNENKGVSYSRNYGIKHATGEYITFVDSDDFIEKNALEEMIRLLIYNKADIVVSGYNEITKNKKIKVSNYKNELINSMNIPSLIKAILTCSNKKYQSGLLGYVWRKII